MLAWLLAATLVFVTWCPQGLRPHFGDPTLERFGAFFVTATLFVIAYPQRARLVAIGVVVFAVVLELGQFLAPGRDPGMPDVLAKALGGLVGAFAGYLALRVFGNASAPNPQAGQS
jgi:VanZ family protein